MFRIVSLGFLLSGCVFLGDTGIMLSGEIVPPPGITSRWCTLRLYSAKDQPQVLEEFSVAAGKFEQVVVNPPSRGEFYATAECPGNGGVFKTAPQDFADAPEYPVPLDLGKMPIPSER